MVPLKFSLCVGQYACLLIKYQPFLGDWQDGTGAAMCAVFVIGRWLSRAIVRSMRKQRRVDQAGIAGSR
jgi:hypothetical protein